MSIAKSDLVTNADANPPTMNDVALMGGRLRVAQGEVTVGTADLTTGDIVLLAKLPTNAIVSGIWLKNTNLDSNATETIEIDVGVYDDAGAVKAVSIYFDGSVDGAAAFENLTRVWTNVFFKEATEAKDKLWVDAGDSTDPGGSYTVGLEFQIGAATAVPGTIAFLIHYTID